MRVLFTALAVWALAGAAHALEPRDLVGQWTTQFANAPGEPADGAGALIIRADASEGMLDGLSGWDGVLTGETSQRADGAVVWSGRWASIWPEGATLGTFEMVFTSADAFTGTWSTDDGEIVRAVWNGRRAP